MRLFHVALALLLCAASLSAQHLLKEISPGVDSSVGSAPRGLVELGGKLLFAASDADGYGLWLSPTDKADPILIRRFEKPNPYAWGSWPPSSFVAINSKVYFKVAVGGPGPEVWVTDGTAEGTHMVVAPHEDETDAFSRAQIIEMTACAGRLYFLSTKDDRDGFSLWCSDGTDKNSRAISDLKLSRDRLRVDGDRLWYAGTLKNGDSEICFHDGKKEVKVAKLVRSKVGSFQVSHGRVFFTRQFSDGVETLTADAPKPVIIQESRDGHQLLGAPLWHEEKWWISWGGPGWQVLTTDGTPVGTSVFSDVPEANPTFEHQFIVHDGQLLVMAPRMGELSGLWKPGKDPKLIWPSESADPFEVHVEGDRAWVFSQGDPDKRRAAFIGRVSLIDGEVEPLEPPKEPFDYISQVGFAGKQTFFAATTRSLGDELYVLGKEGPALFLDLGKKPASTLIADLGEAAGATWFVAKTGHVRELWITEGTPESTRKVAPTKDDRVPRMIRRPGSESEWYFVNATSHESRVEQLWRTDGTIEGTKVVSNYPADLAPSSTPHQVGDRLVWRCGFGPLVSGNYDGSDPVKLTDKLSFSGPEAFGDMLIWRTGAALLASDGTPAGTHRIAEIADEDSDEFFPFLHAMGEFAVFASIYHSAWTIWRTDGTSEGTFRLASTELKDKSAMPTFAGNQSVGCFSLLLGADAQNPWLWKTDGTAEGTLNLAKSAVGTVHSVLGILKDTVMFTVKTGERQFEIWKSDGTLAGTRICRKVGPGPLGWGPVPAVDDGARLFASCGDESGKIELWMFDRTDDKAIRLLEDAGTIRVLEWWNQRLLVASPGTGLWITDGTESGTEKLVGEEFAGGKWDRVNFAQVGGKMLVSVPSNGTAKVWLTDGSAAGTKLIKSTDARVGEVPMTPLGDRVLIQIATELWWCDGTEAGTLRAATGVTALPRFANGIVYMNLEFPGLGRELAVFGTKPPRLDAVAQVLKSGEPSQLLSKIAVQLVEQEATGAGMLVLDADKSLSWSFANGVKTRRGTSKVELLIGERIIGEVATLEGPLRVMITQGTTADEVRLLLESIQAVTEAESLELSIGLSDGHGGVAKLDLTVKTG